MKKVCEEIRVEIKIPFKESKLIEDFFKACDEPIHALNSKLLIVDLFTWSVSIIAFIVSFTIITQVVEILLNHESMEPIIIGILSLVSLATFVLEDFAIVFLGGGLILVYGITAKLADISHFFYHKIHKITAESIMKGYSEGVVRLVLSSKKPTLGFEDIEACLLRKDLLKILKSNKDSLENEGVYITKVIELLEKN